MIKKTIKKSFLSSIIFNMAVLKRKWKVFFSFTTKLFFFVHHWRSLTQSIIDIHGYLFSSEDMLKKWRYPWISWRYLQIYLDICQYQGYLWISQIIIWLLISTDIHKYLRISQIIIWLLISTDIHEHLWISQIIIWNLISTSTRMQFFLNKLIIMM